MTKKEKAEFIAHYREANDSQKAVLLKQYREAKRLKKQANSQRYYAKNKDAIIENSKRNQIAYLKKLKANPSASSEKLADMTAQYREANKLKKLKGRALKRHTILIEYRNAYRRRLHEITQKLAQLTTIKGLKSNDNS